MRVIVFDDNHDSAFYPISLTRSIGDTRCGILKLRQRLHSIFNSEVISVRIPARLYNLYIHRHNDWMINPDPEIDDLWINSRIMIDETSVAAIKALKPHEALIAENVVAACRVGMIIPDSICIETLTSLNYTFLPVNLCLYSNIADVIHDNDRMIRFDYANFFYDKDNYFETEPGVTTLNPYDIWISENVELKPGVVLDASTGPIVLDEGVRIQPNAVIIGPVYIGKKTLVKAGAKIYGPTSIGPVCKVGGEIEGSVIQAYTNKQHEGFLGHSFLGEWINVGADTNNSDLKNTYENVRYYSYACGSDIDSGKVFLGAVIGDHVKLGINTSINTGCVIGVGCNLWGTELITGFIPDFSWGQSGHLTTFRLEKFLQVAGIVKNRRDLILSFEESELLSKIHSSLR